VSAGHVDGAFRGGQVCGFKIGCRQEQGATYGAVMDSSFLLRMGSDMVTICCGVWVQWCC
jgi:hypothetical protein